MRNTAERTISTALRRTDVVPPTAQYPGCCTQVVRPTVTESTAVPVLFDTETAGDGAGSNDSGAQHGRHHILSSRRVLTEEPDDQTHQMDRVSLMRESCRGLHSLIRTTHGNRAPQPPPPWEPKAIASGKRAATCPHQVECKSALVPSQRTNELLPSMLARSSAAERLQRLPAAQQTRRRGRQTGRRTYQQQRSVHRIPRHWQRTHSRTHALAWQQRSHTCVG